MSHNKNDGGTLDSPDYRRHRVKLVMRGDRGGHLAFAVLTLAVLVRVGGEFGKSPR